MDVPCVAYINTLRYNEPRISSWGEGRPHTSGGASWGSTSPPSQAWALRQRGLLLEGKSFAETKQPLYKGDLISCAVQMGYCTAASVSGG